MQGKGLGAVEAAAALLGTFRETGYHDPLLGTVAGRLEVRMLRHVRYRAALGGDEGDRFATGVLVGFPVDALPTVEVVNFGHDPPLVVGPAGVRSLPPGGGLPLGMGELAAGPPPVLRVPLAVGETLLLVTDGVTEARDPAGAFFPLRDAVAEALARDAALADPAVLVRFVRDATLRHAAGRLTDDTTIFAVRRRPGGAAAGPDAVV